MKASFFRNVCFTVSALAPVVSGAAWACPPCPGHRACVGVGTPTAHCENAAGPDLRRIDKITEIQIDGKSFLAGPKEKFSERPQ